MLSSTPVVVCLGTKESLWRRLHGLSAVHPTAFLLAEACENEPALLAFCSGAIPSIVVVADERMLRVAIRAVLGFADLEGVHILLCSEVADRNQLLRLMLEGCSGVVAPSVSDGTLLKVIRCVLSGELWFPRSVLSKLAKDWRAKEPAHNLTSRELDILKLIADGRTNQQIADLCFISRETVRWHIRSIYSKIGVADRKAAILQAKRIAVNVATEEGQE